MYNRKYKFANNHYWYSIETNEITTVKPNGNCIKLDSKQEMILFKRLKTLSDRHGFRIYKDSPLYLENEKWLVDFKLVFSMDVDIPRFIKTLTNLDVIFSNSILYIEYKGVLDKKTEKRILQLSNNDYNPNVIFIGDSSICYSKENTDSMTIYQKQFFTINYFMIQLEKFLTEG